MNEYLLTKDEAQNQWTAMVDEGYKGTIKGYIDYKTMKLFLEAQDRKSRKKQLEQLEKKGMLAHDEVLVVEDGDEQLVGCKLDCRACAKLREVGA